MDDVYQVIVTLRVNLDVGEQLEFVGLQGVNDLGFEIGSGAALSDNKTTEDLHLFLGEVSIGKHVLYLYETFVQLLVTVPDMFADGEAATDTYAEAMTPDGFISRLVAREWDYRSSAAIDRLIRGASFHYNAYPEEIDYSISRGLNQNQMERLLSLDFVRQGQNLFITGSAETGKSFLATAIGYHACKNGIRTLYSNTSKLLSSLKVAKAKNTIETELKKVERCQRLILDDAFLVPLDAKERPILLEIIEDRHDRKSIVMASQLPVENWYDAIGDQAVADAVLDRIVHSSHRIELFGESFRKMKTEK